MRENKVKGKAGKASEITIRSKNDVLREAFAAQIATGHPFIFAIFDSAKPEYRMLGIAQELVVSTSEPTATQKIFWGQFDPRLVRTLQGFAVSQIDEDGKIGGVIECAVGAVLEGFKISVTRHTDPAYEGQKAILDLSQGEDGIDEDGEEIYVTDEAGNELYEHRELVVAA